MCAIICVIRSELVGRLVCVYVCMCVFELVSTCVGATCWCSNAALFLQHTCSKVMSRRFDVEWLQEGRALLG
jgi:hypothetical protein